MNLLCGLNWFRAVTTRRDETRQRAADPSEMGTAFGLDAAIEAEREAQPMPAPAPAPAAAWSRRLDGRPRR